MRILNFLPYFLLYRLFYDNKNCPYAWKKLSWKGVNCFFFVISDRNSQKTKCTYWTITAIFSSRTSTTSSPSCGACKTSYNART